MSEFDLMSFRHEIIENNIILSFEGQISQGVLITLVDTLKMKLMDEEDNNSEGGEEQKTPEENKKYLVRKIYSVFIELAQNLQNHSSERNVTDKNSEGEGIIIIRENDDCYNIESGNLIKKEKIEELAQYIEHLNGLNDSELRKLYKLKLREARNESKRGAGIGLIEMLRKSGNPIAYEMKKIDEQHHFLIITICIAKEEK
ncbi:SiaB family protein kinase [sulfur-oxidizing endosymbiont of Gigantopelta aegis]|uniref:SiaB family protein kinase n=1 Tax=sulfur-oxidizing endosymbiont of Gigantopelta aegis TaxID=2794934 RepID=UPI0018DE3695|nr:SiaB family protein kinase [sulfur-oxidizing endosymbiont of Gigantopelta aegis]